MRFLCACFLGSALLLILPAETAPGAVENCPDAKSARRPFIVDRGQEWRLAVVHVDDTTVSTILRSRGTTILETVEFQGLFQLDRIDRGKRKVFRPKGDLKSFFPIKVGKKIVAEFDAEESGKTSSTKIELIVRKADTLHIGACKYAVFQIQRSESHAGGALQFFNYDYYSPDLKIVVAKEYKNAGRANTWIKYERIYSGDR
jgi:hypothetical protein